MLPSALTIQQVLKAIKAAACRPAAPYPLPHAKAYHNLLRVRAVTHTLAQYACKINSEITDQIPEQFTCTHPTVSFLSTALHPKTGPFHPDQPAFKF